MPGDIVEAGVFQGHTLLATALLLRELGSDKKVVGFDSFTGFPKRNNSLSAAGGMLKMIYHYSHLVRQIRFDD